MRLMLYYMDKGFINVQVGAPKMDIQNGSVKVTYPIHEGDRFQVRNVKVEGDLIIPQEKILSELKIRPRTWFNRSFVGEDIRLLQNSTIISDMLMPT